MKMNQILLGMLFIFINMLEISSTQPEMSDYRSYQSTLIKEFDNKLPSTGLQNVGEKVSKLQCAAACVKATLCESFFYNKRTGDCRLYDADFITTPTQMLSEDGYRCYRNKGHLPLDCTGILQEGKTVSGVYAIYPFGMLKEIFCDQDTDGGRWLVFQRRRDGSEDFYRNWADYEEGFGSLNNEFWIGLKLLHYLTSIKPYEALIELENWSNEKRFAAYSDISVSNSSTFYVLNLGTYTGNEGNSLQAVYDGIPQHDGCPFSAKDQDHSGADCVALCTGGFWYSNKGGCMFANPNGQYLGADNTQIFKGMEWYTWTGRYYSLKKTEMKIRQKTSF